MRFHWLYTGFYRFESLIVKHPPLRTFTFMSYRKRNLYLTAGPDGRLCVQDGMGIPTSYRVEDITWQI